MSVLFIMRGNELRHVCQSPAAFLLRAVLAVLAAGALSSQHRVRRSARASVRTRGPDIVRHGQAPEDFLGRHAWRL